MSLLHLSICFLVSLGQTGANPTDPAVTRDPPAAGNKLQTPPPAKRATAQPGQPTDLDAHAAQWLVELAQHQGHMVGRASPRSASLQVIALLEAARATDAKCAEAYYWLFDLYQRMGRIDPAREALTRYVDLLPTDEAAWLRVLDLQIDSRQSSEERLAFVKAELERPKISPTCESELRRRLARLLYEQRETEAAGKEIERALRLNPANVAARELAYEMFGETEAALQRVELALQMISINPTQANLVWELGEFLDRLSLHKEAQEWFNRAMEMHRRSDARAIPADYWQKLAMSYVASGDFQRAKDSADAALTAEPNHAQVRLLRATALEKLGDAKGAQADRDAVRKHYDEMIPAILDGKLPDKAAEAAWFYSYHQPDAKRAAELAKIAAEQPGGGSLAALARGYTLRQDGKSKEAIDVLKPLAAKDQLAALGLAKALIEQGEKAEAITVLHKAAALQYSGIAYRLISELLEKHGEKPPTAPMYADVKQALERFHRDVFDFPKKPEAFLQCSLRFEEPISPMGPMRGTLRLENVAPFPITLGEGYMVRPLAAISAKVACGDNVTEFKNYQQVLINRRPVLLPGDAVEKTICLDIGPIRQALRKTVLQPTTIELSAWIDPVIENGELAAGPGTVRIGPVRASRPVLDISPTAVNLLVDQSTDRNPRRRIESAQGITAILASVTGQPAEADMPMDKMRAALVSLLKDADWHVRAQALSACEAVPLNDALMQAAAPAVKDEQAVVRMMAVRLFAAKQGKQFMPVLEQLSKSDTVAFVRMTCAGYLPESGAQASREKE